MKLEKFLLRYSPPGIGLAFIQNGQRKEKMINLFNLSPKTDLGGLCNELSEQEPLISSSVKPKLFAMLIKLQEKLKKEINSKYAFVKELSHDLPIASIALNKDGSLCSTGSFDNTCKLWEVNSGSLKATITAHTAPVYALAFNYPLCDRLISGSFDRTACISNVETGQCLKMFVGHRDEVTVVRYEPNNNIIGTASMDNTAKMFDAVKGEQLWTLLGHHEAIVSLHFSSDGRNILTGSFDSNMYLWDSRTHRIVGKFLEHKEEISNCLFDFECAFIGSGSVDKTAKIWDLRSDKSISTMVHEDEVLDVNFDPTGRKFATAASDGYVHIYDLTEGEGELLTVLSGHSKEISKVTFSPGGGLVLSGSADGTSRLWLVESGQCVQILDHKEEIFNCTFSYDGSLIATAANDCSCRLWKDTSS